MEDEARNSKMRKMRQDIARLSNMRQDETRHSKMKQD